MTGAEARPSRAALSLGTAGSRALIVGTGSHVAGSRVPDVPAVAGTVAELGRVLAERCGLRQVREYVDPATPKDLFCAVAEEAEAAEDVFLLYYVGHGLVSLSNELHLAVHSTEDDGIGLPVDALPYSTVRESLAHCRARAVVVILDCCYAGRASGSFATAVADAFESTHVRGSFLLSSAAATERALAPEGAAYTAFSGEFARFLREGSPSALRTLTLEDAYRHLARELPAHGFPEPHRRAGDRAGELVLTSNPAAPPVTVRRPATAASPQGDPVCPYRGLDPFGAEDAGYFFGRERPVREILDKLIGYASGPLAVLGRSGSGKTSLLRAGVLPAMRAGGLAVRGSRSWPQLVVTPGEHPLRVLADRLAQPSGTAADQLHEQLLAEPASLAGVVRTALRRHLGDQDEPGGRLVLVVDQFEELFTLCQDEAERRAFITAVTAANRQAERAATAPLLAVLAIRADFYGHCMAYPALAAVLRDAQVPIPPMTGAELLQVIEKPAELAGLTLEEGLAGQLLQDLHAGRAHEDGDEGEPAGALPLLSHVLRATWQHLEGTTLTLAGYRATGGIWRAVAEHADGVYDGLEPRVRAAARELLLRMVQLGEGTEDTRRPVTVRDLLGERSREDTAAVREALDAFTEARLVAVADDTAAITHEALLRTWPRLRGWLADDRAELLLHQRLASAADAWQQSGRDPALLYGGSRLESARQQYAHPVSQKALSTTARDFLDASTRAHGRRVRRRRALFGVSLLAVLLLVAGGTYAIQQHNVALESQAARSSQQLAAEAEALRGTDPAAALWLSLAAYNSAPSPEARTSLYNSYITPVPTVLSDGRGTVFAVAYAPDGHTVAAAQDRAVHLWNADDPFHPAPRAALPIAGNAVLTFSPDSRLLAARTAQALTVWDVRDPGHPAAVLDLPVAGSDPPAIAFSADGGALAFSGADGTVRLWDVHDPWHSAEVASWRADDRPVQTIAFSRDGHTLATAATTAPGAPDSGRVRLWDVGDERHPVHRADLVVSSALTLAFDPIGDTLVSGGALGDLHEWDVADPAHPRPIDVETTGDRPTIVGVTFRPDGRGFVTADETGAAEYWTKETTGGLVTEHSGLSVPAGLQAIAFSPDSRHLLTGDREGGVRLWNTPAPVLPGPVGFRDGRHNAFNSTGTLLTIDSRNNGDETADANLWGIGGDAAPTLLAALPPGWTHSSFVTDTTLLTENTQQDTLALWDVSNPRTPRQGATIAERDPAHTDPSRPFGASETATTGTLLAVSVQTGDQVELWDVRDYRHPVALGAIALSPDPYDPGRAADGLWFVDDGTLAALTDAGLRLWDVRDPSRPSELTTIEIGDGAGFLYLRARHLLIAPNPSGAGSVIWDLADPGHPVDVSDEAEKAGGARPSLDVPPEEIVPLTDRTVAVAAANTPFVQIVDLTDPGHPTVVGGTTTKGKLNGLNRSEDARFVGGSTFDGQYLWQVQGSDPPVLTEFAEPPAEASLFSPDDRSFVADLPDSVLSPYTYAFTVWPLDTDSLYRRLCAIDTASDERLQQYLPHEYYRPACR